MPSALRLRPLRYPECAGCAWAKLDLQQLPQETWRPRLAFGVISKELPRLRNPAGKCEALAKFQSAEKVSLVLQGIFPTVEMTPSCVSFRLRLLRPQRCSLSLRKELRPLRRLRNPAGKCVEVGMRVGGHQS